MERIEMTQDALLDALQEALADPEDPDGAMTTRELCAALDVGMKKVREMVRAGLENGTVERVKVGREGISGVIQRVPAFRARTA